MSRFQWNVIYHSVVNWYYPVVYGWVPLVMCLVGLAVCLWQGWRKQSIGLILLSVLFANNAVVKILSASAQATENAKILHDFVRRQIGPNLWTAPVLHETYSAAAPFTDGVLLLAAILVARRISKARVA